MLYSKKYEFDPNFKEIHLSLLCRHRSRSCVGLAGGHVAKHAGVLKGVVSVDPAKRNFTGQKVPAEDSFWIRTGNGIALRKTFI